MYIEVCGLKINYETLGEGKVVLILHGWGASITSVKPIINKLSDRFKVIAIDLPGFGESELPHEVWGTKEYAKLVEEFMNKLSIENPIVIGHSFGGRVLIYLTGMMKVGVEKIILIDSAGIKKKKSLKNYIKIYTFKFIKVIVNLVFSKSRAEKVIEKARKKFGSADYKNSSGLLRQIMVRVINEDLRCYLPQIKASTLLIWGENDHDTPISDGKTMEKMIPDAGLVTLKNAGHFSYLDRPYEFNLILEYYLTS